MSKDVFGTINEFRYNPKPHQTCTTCGEKGHTYLACKKIDFFEALDAALRGES